MERFICIHGHFYQPPRENPWLEELELQESAYPYHDWNQRITAECYAPNMAARNLDPQGKITQITNNYSKMSFNFGPTLLSWMERKEPETYRAILQADQESQQSFSGHGNALAQCYNHIIMPLANRQDKYTQVLWGIKDFEKRFGRYPEGMWLPETAVDLETLDILAGFDIKFTILSPYQAQGVRKIDSNEFSDASGGKVDPKKAYICLLPSGRKIVVFFYDGPISQDIAFGDLLSSGEHFYQRMISGFSEEDCSQLVHIATDGETYGHHHAAGDMTLAYFLNRIEKEEHLRLTNYGEFLSNNPPEDEVRINERTSWSCYHGVERWRSDCGCRIGTNAGWTQEWRRPLREALDWLRDNIGDLYVELSGGLINDPVKARNEYIEVVLDRSDNNVEKFLSRQSSKNLTEEDKVKILKLMEMRRYAMLMFTSCGWFFDEVSRIETIQILRYASRAIQLAQEVSGLALENFFKNLLARVPSNIPKYRDGRQLYEIFVKPSIVDLPRVGAHYAVTSLFEDYAQSTKIYCYSTENHLYDRQETNSKKLAIGQVLIRSDITWEKRFLYFAVFHLGAQNLVGGIGEFADSRMFMKMQQQLKNSFKGNNDDELAKIIKDYFGEGHYSLQHLFKDEQSKILYQILGVRFEEVEASLRKVNEHHYPLIQIIKQLHIPLPKVLVNTVLVMLNTDLLRVVGGDPIDFQRLEELVNEVEEWSLEIDKITLGFMVTRKIDDLMARFVRRPRDIRYLESIAKLLNILESLHLTLNLWKTQNQFFYIGSRLYPSFKHRAEKGNLRAQKWMEYYDSVGEYLKVRIV